MWLHTGSDDWGASSGPTVSLPCWQEEEETRWRGGVTASLSGAKGCDDTLVTCLVIVLARTEFILGQKRGELPFKPAVFSPSCSNDTWGETLTVPTAAEHTGNQKHHNFLPFHHFRFNMWNKSTTHRFSRDRPALTGSLSDCLTSGGSTASTLTLGAAAARRRQTKEQRTVSLSNTFN